MANTIVLQGEDIDKLKTLLERLNAHSDPLVVKDAKAIATIAGLNLTKEKPFAQVCSKHQFYY